jgi:hypothetical protein
MARPDLAGRLEQFFRDLDLPPDGRGYVDLHTHRLVQTLLRFLPPGAREARWSLALLHMAPALHLFLEYGQVRAAYYGHLGETKSVGCSIGGREVFRCDVDGFDVRVGVASTDSVVCSRAEERSSALNQRERRLKGPLGPARLRAPG